MHLTLTESLALGQIIVTTAGFLFAILQLHNEYRWRRRQYAVSMLAEWNHHTAPLRKTIEKFKPGLLDFCGKNANTTITPAEAEEIYAINPTDEQWELRCAIIELLNYCEYIAVSERQGIGDPKVLNESFTKTITHWYSELENYLLETTEKRGYNPWLSLTNAVVDWKHELPARQKYAAPQKL